jgi:ElaA protein
MVLEQELVLHKKSYQELTVDELYELLRVRSEVFVVEQNCVYQDLDGDDQKSIHLWLTVADKLDGIPHNKMTWKKIQ